MNLLLNIIKVIIGIIAVFLIHIPKLVFRLLLLSYAAVFNNRPNITADPKEHLRRAKCHLKKKHNSLLLYAAIELRFCVERISKGDLYITSISNKQRKKYEPSKHITALRNAEPDSAVFHKMYLRNRKTGIKIDFGTYKPLDKERVDLIIGKLGDILHPKVGITLGLENCDWYKETRQFLWETYYYLSEIIKDRRPYMSDEGFDKEWEVIRE